MKECQNIEWKESWNDDYLKWICAFANTDGGSLCIGIDDHGQIFPLKNEKKLLEDLPNKIRDVLGIIADVRLVATDKGDYIRVDVPAYPNLINYHGRFYYRSGSTTQELKGAALERMILKKRGTTWDTIQEPNASLNDLSSEAIEMFKNAVKQRDRMPDIGNETTESILEHLHLLEHGILNRAGILLFHKAPERFVIGSYVKIGFFQTDAELLYQDEIHGPLFLQVEKVVDLLLTKYMKAYISYRGITRIEKYLFDPDAIREAVLNCLIHKEYSSMIPIQIKVYEDKICFYNSGLLPENWTIENLYQRHGSRPFNPLIAEVFFKAGAIEAWGRGISKIFEACRNDGIAKPVYEFYAGSGFSLLLNAEAKVKELSKVNFSNPSIGDESAVSLPNGKSKEKSNEKRRKGKERILEAIVGNPFITIKELAQITGLSSGGVEKNLRLLRESGIVRHVPPDNGGHWEILKPEGGGKD